MDIGSVREHNRDFIAVMDEVRREVVRNRRLELDREFSQAAMTRLRDAGLSAYQSLGDQASDCLDEYEARDTGAGLEVTVRAHAHPLLWEFIYTGSAIEPPDYQLFWGYRHSLARFLIGAEFFPVDLEPYRGLLFCRNRALGCWQDERDALCALLENCGFSILDDYLDDLVEQQSKRELHDQALWVWTRSPGFSFLHLASHLFPDPRPQSVLGAHLAISYRDRDIEITLRRLNAVRRDWKLCQNPLVFMNACKTMTNPELLAQSESFPRSFLKLGAGAVIATACDVPDLFALEFARKFYEIFLDQDHRLTASEALRQTRWFFIERYNNPLGLAYGLYAHNHLRVYW
jgi:hypothetical protein